MTTTAQATTVADELAIRDLAHRYADAVSRRDPTGIVSVFITEGEWLGGGLGEYRGHDQLAGFFTTSLDGWTAFFHAIFSGLVFLDTAHPDQAQGRWFVMETGHRVEGNSLSVTGVYHDEYVREADAWRISRRKFDPLLIRADDNVTTLQFPADTLGIE